MRPNFTMQISLGHVIQLTVVVLTVGVAWQSLAGQAKDNSKEIERLQSALTTLAQTTTKSVNQIERRSANEFGKIRSRMRINETTIARQDERYSSIMALLGRIDSRLERMEDKR